MRTHRIGNSLTLAQLLRPSQGGFVPSSPFSAASLQVARRAHGRLGDRLGAWVFGTFRRGYGRIGKGPEEKHTSFLFALIP